MSVRETCADWSRQFDPVQDPVLKGKKDSETGFNITISKRNVGPSSTQLYMIRTMLESLIADKSGGKRTLRKDIDGQYLVLIDQFHKNSFYWNYLLSFSGKYKVKTNFKKSIQIIFLQNTCRNAAIFHNCGTVSFIWK